MRAYPFVVGQNTSGRSLEAIGDTKVYDEAWLQELLRQRPDILPVAEIEPVFAPLIPIGREVWTEAGPIDNLFISGRGYLVLVETKLWRNPEAKREVVAQAIDYADPLSRWGYDKVNKVAGQYTRKYEGAEVDLVEWVERRLGPVEGGRAFFEETVGKNLRLGRFLTLLVGDRIRESVVAMLNAVHKYPALALNVALVELQGFWLGEGQTWPMLLVPRIVAQTEIVERTVVQVTVVNGQAPDVKAWQEKVTADEAERKRISLSEEAFWELLKQRAPSQYDAVRRLVSKFKGQPGLEVSPRASSLVMELSLDGTGQSASLFFVNAKGEVHVWPKTLGQQLAAAGVDRSLVAAYDRRMRTLLRMPETRTDCSRSVDAVDVEQFEAAVNEFIQQLRGNG